MRILIVYPYFGTPKGSWSTRIYELSKRWIAKGAEVEVITAPYAKSDIRASHFIESQIVEGIKLTVINCADDNRLPLYSRAFNAGLFSVVATFLVLIKRYDVLLASSGPITVGLPMIFARIFRLKKTVFEVRDLWPEGAIQMKKIKNKILIIFARFFEQICYFSATAVVTASPGMREGVLSVFHRKNKIHVFPNAADINLFQIPETKPDRFIEALEGKTIIIYAGSLGEMDECETAVKAMEHFRNDSISLVIVGDGVEKIALEELAQQIKNPNIHFLGLIPKTEVVKWYSIADASLVGFKNFPVLSTSSPNKMFDSFAAGVPIIQNTNGWIKELIDKDGGGYNVQYQSVSSYIAVFSKLMKDKNDFKKQGERAYQLACTRFNRDTIAKDYYLLLSSII